MKKHSVAISFAAILFMVGVAQAQIKIDYDHHANFAEYKTYSWGKIQTSDGLWDERVSQAVSTQLVAKGWTEVPSGGDVVITAMGTTRDEHTLNTFYDGFGGWRWRGFGDATTTVDTYEVGTLVVDMFDNKTKGLIWRASASGTVSNNVEKNIKNFDKNVQKMFDHFPPGSIRK